MNKKIYLITGASSDLGLALLERLPLNSDDVVIAHYHSNNAQLEELAFRRNAQFRMLQADFTGQEQRAHFIEEVKALDLIPTHLVHICSLIPENRRFKEMKSEYFERNFSVQVLSAVDILGFLLPHMAKRKQGNIVFVLSSSVIGKPPKYMSDYITAKYALLGLMRTLVSEYAEKQIRINAVSPSMMESKFLKKINPKIIEAAAYQSPMKRNAAPLDVVPAVLYLLSEESAYLNGANIPITGGSEF